MPSDEPSNKQSVNTGLRLEDTGYRIKYRLKNWGVLLHRL
jgi:hypothetical protein